MPQPTSISKLESSLSQLTIAFLRAEGKPQPEGEWPLNTILIHLWLTEEVVWQVRLKQMAAEDNPHWVWTEPNLDAAIAQLGGRPLPELSQLFTQRRNETLNLLRALDEAGWARVGTHARFGQMDVAGLCDRILEHDEEHLVELKRRAPQTSTLRSIT